MRLQLMLLMTEDRDVLTFMMLGICMLKNNVLSNFQIFLQARSKFLSQTLSSVFIFAG